MISSIVNGARLNGSVGSFIRWRSVGEIKLWLGASYKFKLTYG